VIPKPVATAAVQQGRPGFRINSGLHFTALLAKLFFTRENSRRPQSLPSEQQKRLFRKRYPPPTAASSKIKSRTTRPAGVPISC
jgi:hypothetical protein